MKASTNAIVRENAEVVYPGMLGGGGDDCANAGTAICRKRKMITTVINFGLFMVMVIAKQFIFVGLS